MARAKHDEPIASVLTSSIVMSPVLERDIRVSLDRIDLLVRELRAERDRLESVIPVPPKERQARGGSVPVVLPFRRPEAARS